MREEISIKLRQIFKENGLVLVYLFGSQVKGTFCKESDIDIAVLFQRNINPEDYLKLEGKLIGIFSELYSQREINIVNLNIASPLLKQTVILEGKLIYKEDDLNRILFEVQTLKEYEEYRYFNNIYQQFFNLKLEAL